MDLRILEPRSHPATGQTPDRAALESLYAYPDDLQIPWVRMNFVSSLDGAVAVEGRSGALGSPSDKLVFGLLRELCDVVVVGAGTVRAENYGGTRTSESLQRRRIDAGLSPVAPVAVVTASGDLDPNLRVFTDTTVAPVVLTTDAAPPTARRRLESAGADVRVIGEKEIDGAALRAACADAGWPRVLCEGGPRLFGRMIVDGVVDDLCLTWAPVLAAGAEGRIATAPQAALTEMVRAHLLADTDGTLLGRWIRADHAPADTGAETGVRA